MILKEKDAFAGTDECGFYGHKQEQDVAFHLRREFGDSEQIRVIETEFVAARQEGHVSPADGVAEAPPETRSPQRDPSMHDADEVPPMPPWPGTRFASTSPSMTCSPASVAAKPKGSPGYPAHFLCSSSMSRGMAARGITRMNMPARSS
ncbi:hypothetical protein LG302_13795 [Halomonas organivorans]